MVEHRFKMKEKAQKADSDTNTPARERSGITIKSYTMLIRVSSMAFSIIELKKWESKAN